MAGGFFREDSKAAEVEVEPFILSDLPKVSNKVAQASVSLSLDAEASSTDESGGEEEFEDVAVNVLPTASTSDTMRLSKNGSQVDNSGGDDVSHISASGSNTLDLSQFSFVNHPKSKNLVENAGLSDAAVGQQVCSNEGSNSKVASSKETELDEVQLIGLKMDTDDDKFYASTTGKKTDGDASHIVINNDNSSGDKTVSSSQTTSLAMDSSVACSSIQNQPAAENLSLQESVPETIIELDDLEDEINQKKRLIEKLLSTRGTLNAFKPSSDAGEVSLGDKNSLSEQVDVASGVSLEQEKASSDEREINNAQVNNTTSAIESTDDIPSSTALDGIGDPGNLRGNAIDLPPVNEFEGITYVSTFARLFLRTFCY